MDAVSYRRLNAIAAAVGAFGCTSAGAQSPPTIGLVALIENVESYRGQIVRTCGQRIEPGDSAWHLILPLGRHGARLLVISSGERPILDANGCIVGRIARRDGSTSSGPPGEPGVVADDIVDYTWFLHERPIVDRRDPRPF